MGISDISGHNITTPIIFGVPNGYYNAPSQGIQQCRGLELLGPTTQIYRKIGKVGVDLTSPPPMWGEGYKIVRIYQEDNPEEVK